MKSYTDEQIELYRQKHSDNSLKTTTETGVIGTWGGAKDYFLEYSQTRVVRLENFLKTLKIKTILDFGCGKGFAADTIKEKFPHLIVSKYDPAFESFSVYPQGKFDLVLCFLVIHLADLDNKKRIAEELSSLSSRYIILTALVDNGSDDKFYQSLFPKFKVKMFNKWKVALPIPSHRGNDCVTLILEKIS